ncbi:helix-turn-helix transcriptional regulator [Microbacterium rhizophilus]|uniref:helix-turn-helix transcriptional regulator n=1 Tax=Microbacterium rhizophilus TaxID=3138934 RepID=UPI0031EE88DF
MPPIRFLGRTDELHRLHTLISGARNHVAGALVVVGEPGVGKSTLLAEATAQGTGARVVSIDGYAVESRIAYGGLHRLGRALGAQLDVLSDRQRRALLVAAGLRDGPPPELALVALATLSLLAAASEHEPLVCAVDDAHHLDPETLEVLGFVARRLSAERLALLFACREDEGVVRALAGVPSLRLEGLDPATATELLREHLGAMLDPVVAGQVIAETGGNPLALTELGEGHDVHQLTRAVLSGSPVPIGRRLERHYLGRVDGLPGPARRWLLLAAAESRGDTEVVRASARRLGLPDDAASEAEVARLVEIHDRIRFRHAMVRAAVYNAASDADRRAVHRALREETAARGLDEVSSWHAATVVADREVVDELVALADRASSRGGQASRARLLARAADLAGDTSRRRALLITAGEAAVRAGSARLALELVDEIDVGDLGPVERGRLLCVRAFSGLFMADPTILRAGARMLLEAADCFHDLAPELEQRTLLHTLNFALAVELDMAGGVTLEVLGRRFIAGAAAAEGPYAIVLRALAAFVLEPYADAIPRLKEARATLEALDDATLLEFSYVLIPPTLGLWDIEGAARLLERTIRIAREHGALREADSALWVLSSVAQTLGDMRRAQDCMDQAAELRRAVGYEEQQVVNPALLAWAGAPDELVEQIVAALAAAGWAGVVRIAEAALAIGHIADGRHRQAYERLAALVAEPFLQATFHQLAELVEAASRCGERAAAERATAQLCEYARLSGQPWARAMAERCLALLAEDADAEAHYLASLRHLAAIDAPGELGRGHLLYGEWLRRVRRRRDAKDELHTALELLERVGAVRFAARARRELAASGEDPQQIQAARTDLTGQEAVVARLAARGATNAEIGAALFISPNTVDYHLRKIYRKLGVNSRRQLADLAVDL